MGIKSHTPIGNILSIGSRRVTNVEPIRFVDAKIRSVKSQFGESIGLKVRFHPVAPNHPNVVMNVVSRILGQMKPTNSLR